MQDKGSINEVNSIFEQPWWLDAVAPGQWGEAIVMRHDRVIARLPYFKTRKVGFKTLGMPKYTQTLGYWIEDTGAKNSKKYSKQKDVLSELLERLPQNYNVDMALDHNCQYLFPFKWNGFSLKLLYSYRLERIDDTEFLWKGLGENIRREIKKARKVLKVDDSRSIDELIRMQEMTFARQGRSYRVDADLLRRLDLALCKHDSRKLLCAIDGDGRIHAASYFVYDKKCCYYLIGGSNPKLRNSGAASLLMWEGIQFASTVSQSFDFEGSMIDGIERFFRAFGGVPTPYWQVTRQNLILHVVDYVKPKIKNILGWK